MFILSWFDAPRRMRNDHDAERRAPLAALPRQA